MIRALLILLCSLAPLSAYDPGLEGPGLSIDLITENRSITAGKPFTVGLHIHHFAGFHTYWQNPGMVGIPSTLDWELPPGFSASEIQWPFPEKTHMGEYPCYGYERDVTLLVTITPPASLPQKSVTLKTNAMWMSCSRGCFPGAQTFNMTLPVTTAPIPDHTAQAHFAQARKELPLSRNKAKLTLLSKATDPVIRVRIAHPDLSSTSDLHLYTTDRQISSDHPQKLEKQDDGSLVLEVPRSEFGPESPEELSAVLQLDQRFLAVSAPYSR
ncbi:protein-disulfide reductase DsbD domain-containing protein [Verrucomicrobiaceae bacterium 227]